VEKGGGEGAQKTHVKYLQFILLMSCSVSVSDIIHKSCVFF